MMSCTISYLNLVDDGIQHVHKAWLQRGSSTASLQPGPSQGYKPPGTGARVRFMLALISAIISSGFVRESRVQDHSRSPGGDHAVVGQALCMSESTEKHDVS